MPDLIADRFRPSRRHHLDIATGRVVSLHVEAAGARADQLSWSQCCETLSTLRHDVINPLVDFGTIGASARFAAFECLGPVRAAGATAVRLLEHGVRFLHAHGVALAAPACGLALRPVIAGPAVPRRPLGVALQPRLAYQSVLEALEASDVAGVSRIAVAGPSHSGLRTLRLLVARAARLAGYVPIDAAVAAQWPDLTPLLRQRHVCVLADGGEGERAAAPLLACLGACSARRHLIVVFSRRPAERTIHVERMGVAAMTAMVHLDREWGLTPDDILAAAREAEGRPGLLVARLAGGREPAASAMVVRETAPAYGAANDPAPARAMGRLSAVLRGAGARAARLSDRGRHAAAARVLSRAMRVMAGRGAREQAAACALQLGGLWLERGHEAPAVRAFEAARDYATTDATRLASALGIGDARLVAWRLGDAEAAFRATAVAAAASRLADLQAAASARLADCLCRQGRDDEAEVVLDQDPAAPGISPRSELVRTRVLLARGSISAAAAAAQRALAEAQRSGRAADLVDGHEAVARTQAALGDPVGAAAAIAAGLRAARQAHLSGRALHLHIVQIELLGRACGAAPHAGRLPPMLRAELAAATAPARPPAAATPSDLEAMLVIAQSAEDDRQSVDRVCDAVREQSGARSVIVLGPAPGSPQLALAGRPWHGEPLAALRVLSGEAQVRADPSSEPCQAAQPVRCAGDIVGAIACRFAAGASVHVERTAALLRAAALAIAPAVRGLADRAESRPADGPAGDLLGESAPARGLREAAARAARAPFPVLIEGESGSGKELVARASTGSALAATGASAR